MPIFRLEKSDGNDTSKAKLVIAQETNIEFEQHLEDWLENSPRQTLAREDFLWIGRQTSASDADGTIFLDLLGVDSKGNLIIVELKRDRAPRDVIAQLLEYAASADALLPEQIHEIAKNYFKTREEFSEKTFDDAFREAFDMPDDDEVPLLNQKLRLFIVAEEIPWQIIRVCQFLRTSYKMDIGCIAVSKFQTKSGDEIVSTETKVGDEKIATSKKRHQQIWQTSRWSGNKLEQEQVVWEAVQEFTNGDSNTTFAPADIDKAVESRYSDFPVYTVRRWIRGGCVNFPKRSDYPESENKYWWVERGKYRLYNPETDA